MKRIAWTLGIICTGAVVAIAQPPGGPRGGGGPGGPGGQGGPGGGPGGNFQPPPSPIVEALDTDHDHVISATEIENAPRSLLTADTNKDGKLTEDEYRPRFPGGGQGGQPGMRGNGQRGNGQRNQGGGPGGPGGANGRGGGPGGGPGNGPPGAGGPGGPERFVEHAMQFDADKDGKLSRDELAKFADDFGQRFGGPGGPGGGGPDGPGGPGGNGPGQGNGGNTQRPRRPE